MLTVSLPTSCRKTFTEISFPFPDMNFMPPVYTSSWGHSQTSCLCWWTPCLPTTSFFRDSLYSFCCGSHCAFSVFSLSDFFVGVSALCPAVLSRDFHRFPRFPAGDTHHSFLLSLTPSLIWVLITLNTITFSIMPPGSATLCNAHGLFCSLIPIYSGSAYSMLDILLNMISLIPIHPILVYGAFHVNSLIRWFPPYKHSFQISVRWFRFSIIFRRLILWKVNF